MLRKVENMLEFVLFSFLIADSNVFSFIYLKLEFYLDMFMHNMHGSSDKFAKVYPYYIKFLVFYLAI